MSQVKGYNIAFKVDGKTLAGVTQDDMSISAETKESITKADAGVKQKSVVRQNVSFSCQGIVDITGGTTVSARDTIVTQAFKTGSQAEIEFLYHCTGGTDYEGTCIMTAYSESSGSEDEATYNATFEVVGEMEEVSE